MDERLKLLQRAAIDALGPLWGDFAKQGKESAVLAPLARYPNASAWLARSMGMSSDDITRKIGAMLAGWVRDTKHVGLLFEMLDRERKVFPKDSASANSVGEDIMFAATRWTQSPIPQIRDAGIQILVSMIMDALNGTHWNSVNWAIGNLNKVTEGKHAVFHNLANATDAQMEGQRFLQIAVGALRQKDEQKLARLATAPSGLHSLSSDDPHYPMASALWRAAESAEAALM